jgi:hypothetical protein
MEAYRAEIDHETARNLSAVAQQGLRAVIMGKPAIVTVGAWETTARANDIKEGRHFARAEIRPQNVGKDFAYEGTPEASPQVQAILNGLVWEPA